MNFASACAQAGANVAAMDIDSAPPKDFSLLQKMDARVEYYQLGKLTIKSSLIILTCTRVDVTNAKALEKATQDAVKDFGGINGW